VTDGDGRIMLSGKLFNGRQMKGSDFFMRLMLSVGLIGIVILGGMLFLNGGLITEQIYATGMLFGAVMVGCLVLAALCGIWE